MRVRKALAPEGRASIPCSGCHALQEEHRFDGDAQAGGVHTGLTFDHGALTCGACHAEDAVDELHLADGTRIPMVDAMALCGQCHGPQLRDYKHGAHGGMRGYWDLSRGPRERNHCIDCHAPHAPAFPTFMPLPAPPKEAH